MRYPELKAIAESKECFVYIESSILVLWTVRQNRLPFSPVESHTPVGAFSEVLEFFADMGTYLGVHASKSCHIVVKNLLSLESSLI